MFHARDEALELAFPDAERREAKDFLLTAEQRSRIEELARAPLASNLLTVYVGHRGERIVGYAVIDTHIVRTLPEAFLVVLGPDGDVVATHVLAFYEPLDYLPSELWLEQFRGKSLGNELRIDGDVAGITGSTLTARAVSASIRRALAIHQVLLAKP